MLGVLIPTFELWDGNVDILLWVWYSPYIATHWNQNIWSLKIYIISSTLQYFTIVTYSFHQDAKIHPMEDIPRLRL